MTFSNLSAAAPDLVDTPIDQVNEELIYAMIMCPKWYPIKYVEGGIYDRCIENFKAHAKEESLTDNDKYDWLRIPTKSNIHSIWLAKPGKKVKRKPKIIPDRRGNLVTRELWVNVVRMDLFFYKSMVYKNVQGFTFGDKRNILKPLKLLEHKWVPRATDWNKDLESYRMGTNYNSLKWICSNCGLTGSSISEQKAALIPDKLITCDEMTVADIII